MFSCTRDDPLRDRRSPPSGGRFASRVGIGLPRPWRDGSDPIPSASPAPGGTGLRPSRVCPVRDASSVGFL